MIIEQKYYQHLQQEVNRITDGKNRIYYSEYFDHYSDNIFRNFSIKFSLQGNIHFKTENGEFDLHPGFYLLSYKQRGIAFHESKTPVRCICIDIQQETIKEAFDLLYSKGIYEFYNMEPSHFFSSDFFECIYPLGTSDLGNSLVRLGNSLTDKSLNGMQINKEIFLNIAENVIVNELANYKSLRNLQSIRNTTKRETLRRLLQGKNFIDENYLKNPGIAEITKFCNLSSFHFFRSFKQAFGCTPYQYMLQKRLEYAGSLVSAGLPITHIASQCNFSDLFTFSKAFKRFYGVSPLKYKNCKTISSNLK